MLMLLQKWGVTTIKIQHSASWRSAFWHKVQSLPHRPIFYSANTLLNTWGGQWPGNLDNLWLEVMGRHHYRSVNRERFVCLAHSELNAHRQNHGLISFSSVESKPCVGGWLSTAVPGRSVPVLFPCLLFRKVAHKLARGAKACWALNWERWLALAQPSGNHTRALICKRSEL